MTETYVPFVLFGPSHLITVATALVLPLILALIVWFHPTERLVKSIRWTFATILIVTWASWYVAAYTRGWMTLGNAIPMNLCDWATAATIIALLSAKQKAYELAYFWALGGTLQGLITPDTPFDYPEIRFVIFSIYHGSIIAAVLFLTFGARMRPYPASIPRVIGWSLFYAMCAGLVDWLLGVNYGFLRHKPLNASLYDIMPDWPWYIPVVIALGFVSLLIYYLPFAIWDTFSKKKNSAVGR